MLSALNTILLFVCKWCSSNKASKHIEKIILIIFEFCRCSNYFSFQVDVSQKVKITEKWRIITHKLIVHVLSKQFTEVQFETITAFTPFQPVIGKRCNLRQKAAFLHCHCREGSFSDSDRAVEASYNTEFKFTFGVSGTHLDRLFVMILQDIIGYKALLPSAVPHFPPLLRHVQQLWMEKSKD